MCINTVKRSFPEPPLCNHCSVHLQVDNSAIQTLPRFDNYTAKFTCYVLPADMNFSLSLTATNVSWIFVAFGLKGYTKTSCSFCLNSTHAHTFIRSEKGRTTSIIYTWSVSVCQYVLEYFPNWNSQCSPWSLNKTRNYFDNFTAAEYKCLSLVLLLQITD